MTIKGRDDNHLFVEVRGTGMPLLLLHGGMADHKQFELQRRHFERRFQVIRMDSRGHGRSEHGDVPLTLSVLAGDVLNVLDALKIKRVILLGFSDGANVALKFAKTHPERVRGMILISPNIDPQGLKSYFRMLLKGLRQMTKPFAFLERYRQRLDLMLEPQALEDGCKVPSMLLTGQYDLINRRHIDEIARVLKNAKVYTIPHAGHNLLRRHHRTVNGLSDGFLRMLGKVESQAVEQSE
ncbi:MAG: hypothetical protein PWQ12_273 [Clostridiales bacterium]|nr:hypothetical protein [Clostridiales bacterium]